MGGRPGQLSVGDLDGDGRPDLAIPWGADDLVAVYCRNPQATSLASAFPTPVRYPTLGSPLGCVILDVDGDGRNDLVVGSQSANSLNIFLQR